MTALTLYYIWPLEGWHASQIWISTVQYSTVVDWEGPSVPRRSLGLMGMIVKYCTPVSQVGLGPGYMSVHDNTHGSCQSGNPAWAH